MNTYIFRAIYALGYVLCYYITRHLIKKDQNYKWTWSDVGLNLLFGIMSWLGLFILFAFYIAENVKIKLPSKPPKWL